MANTSELEKGLNELKRLTGITLAVTAKDSEQEQMALEQIRCLCLAYREKYNKNDIKRFDIVVVKMDKELLIKRVIGLPNEEIKYVDNKLYINGEYIKEPFLNDDVYTTNFSLDDFKLKKIPENCYFVMGDNREVSLDSRTFGCFSKDKILGSANLVLFPFTKLGYKK